MPGKSTKRHLDHETQGRIYLQLSKLLKTGLSTEQLITHIRGSIPHYTRQIQQFSKFLSSGHSLVKSGYLTGIISTADYPLLLAGEESGKINHILDKLAQKHINLARRRKKLLQSLLLPIITLVLALIIQPLPQLLQQQISFAYFSFIIMAAILKISLILLVVLRLPFWLTQGPLKFLGMSYIIYQLQLKLPFIASWLTRRQLHDFLFILGLMLEAGLPALNAFTKAADGINNPILATHIRKAGKPIEKGCSLSESLQSTRVFDPRILQTIANAEVSGKLASTLQHFVQLESESLALQDALFTEWVPRVISLLIAIWTGYVLVAGRLHQLQTAF